MRLLIDECLNPKLALIAYEAGYEAYHIAHVGKASWVDRDVMLYASAGYFVLVTNNASDFRRLYGQQPLHAGLIIIVPNVHRSIQQLLFRAAIAQLASTGEPINRVLEIDIDGDDVTFNSYDLPHRSI